MNLLAPVAEFAAGITFRDLPSGVAEDIKRRFLDTIGLAWASMDTPAARASLHVTKEWGGPRQASVIGIARKFPATSAVLVNGTLAHALDFDDTHVPSILHPSAVVVPTVLAVGEITGSSGQEVVAAAAVGYEVCVRLGMAAYDPDLRNSVFFEKGLHATSICGTLAAAVASAKLMGGGAAQIGHALGVAASMGAGLLEANRTGGLIKQLHCGWAGHAGIAAAQLALQGLTAPPTILEGRFGFYHAFCDGRYDPDSIVKNLGHEWEVTRTFIKPYPANIFTHCAIDAALQVRSEVVDLREIERIDLGVAAPTLRTIGEPRELKIHPESGYAARFSGPFTVATALQGGGGLGVYLNDFSDGCVNDQERLDLAARVYCYAEPACDTAYPYHFPAVLRVRLNSGQVIERRVMENRGSPTRPLSLQEVRKKFALNTAHVLTSEQIDRVIGRCADLGGLPRVDQLVRVRAD